MGNCHLDEVQPIDTTFVVLATLRARVTLWFR